MAVRNRNQRRSVTRSTIVANATNLARECPTCGAKPFLSCRTVTNRPMTTLVHAYRVPFDRRKTLR